MRARLSLLVVGLLVLPAVSWGQGPICSGPSCGIGAGVDVRGPFGGGIGIEAGIGGGRCVVPARPPQGPRHATDARWPWLVVVKRSDGRSANIGSGALIAKHPTKDVALVLTCDHVLEDQSGPIMVTVHGEGQFEAVVTRKAIMWDLALLSIRKPKARAVELSREPVQVGDAAWIGGFGAGRARWLRGQVIGFASPQSDPRPHWFTISANAISGDSGGPVLNAHGQVCGVLWGSDGQTTATNSAFIWELFEECLTPEDAAEQPAPSTPQQPPVLNPLPPAAEGACCPSSPEIDQRVAEAFRRLDALEAKCKDCQAPASQVTAIQQALVEVKQQVTQLSLQVTPANDEKLAGINARLVNLESLAGDVAHLAARVEVLESRPTVAPVNVAQLTEEVKRKLPPVHIQVIGPDGKVKSEARVPLGYPVKLRLVPKTKGTPNAQ